MNFDEDLKLAKKITNILDTEFNIFSIRFGIDPILDIIPGLGSIMGAFTSLYIFWIALKIKLPIELYLRMLINIFLDFLLGLIPIAGIVFDIFYRSNVKNLKILESFIEPEELIGEVV